MRAIAEVTYEDEWIANANISSELKEKVEHLDGPLRSKIIHRLIAGENLSVVYVPSVTMVETYDMNEDTFLNGMHPSWAFEAVENVSEQYTYDLVDLSFINPMEVAPVYPDGAEAEDILDEDEPSNRVDSRHVGDTPGEQGSTVEDSLNTADTSQVEGTPDQPLNPDDNQYIRDTPVEVEQADPIYLQAAQNIRSRDADVVLFDMTTIVEHFEEEYPTYREVALVTREFLQTLYRSRDRFYTILLVENSVYERLGYTERSENLDEYIQNLVDQMQYVDVHYMDQEQQDWNFFRAQEISELFY
ncbi:hypothetical protein ACERII_24245 [Evansella sp. AB-rgal1]|uniref:hypothetical protein n=1 Tax=Evansella sp. AB-rgal1 TaxID=3242696 RepID=UPI00359CDFBE